MIVRPSVAARSSTAPCRIAPSHRGSSPGRARRSRAMAARLRTMRTSTSSNGHRDGGVRLVHRDLDALHAREGEARRRRCARPASRSGRPARPTIRAWTAFATCRSRPCRRGRRERPRRDVSTSRRRRRRTPARSARSCANTPWCPTPRMPVMRIWSAIAPSPARQARRHAHGVLLRSTSCTRTAHTPVAAASAVMASVAASRSLDRARLAVARRRAARRGTACARRRRARGSPRSQDGRELASSCQLWSRLLGEAEAGIEDDGARGRCPAATRGVDPVAQLAETSATTSSYCARSLMRSLWPAPVHRDVRHAAAPRRRAYMAGSARPPLTSLTMHAPAATAARRALGPHGVDAHRNAGRREARRRPAGPARSSSSTGTRWAPGRVDSPPTSTMSAPVACRSQAVLDGGRRRRGSARRRRTSRG